MPTEAAVLTGSYDYRLVALSVLLAILASYAAVTLAARIKASRGRAGRVWLAGGAAAVGLGIWSMDCIGMLAYNLPWKVLYHWPTILVSLAAALSAAGVALWVASRKEMGPLRIGGGGFLMGIGIAAMHYAGMHAMRLQAMCRYSRPLVILSVGLAIVISCAALWLTFHLNDEASATRPQKLSAAAAMGLAIAVIHYTGMAAASFVALSTAGDVHVDTHVNVSRAVEISLLGTVDISSATTMILCLTILASLVDRRWSAQASRVQYLVQDAIVVRGNFAQTEERLRLAVRSSGIVVWSWEIAADIVEADENCAVLFGVSAREFPKTIEGFATLVHPEDRERIQQEVRASLSGGEYDIEFRVVWPAGAVRRVASRGKVYYDEAGQPRRLTGVSWDVTERRQTEEKLRTTAERLVGEAKFRELMEAAPDAVLVWNEEGKIVLVNTQVERLFGYGREELLGQTVEMLVPAFFADGHARDGADTLGDPGPFDMGAGLELWALRKDGSEFPTEIRLNPVETDEGILVSVAIRDITERKRAEEQILSLNEQLKEAAAAADAANRAKSTFLSTMSHEIRTPMNAILGYAQLMLRDPEMGADAKVNLRIIGRSGEHLLALINDVLDMSKIEAGRTELNAATFNLPSLLDDLAAMFRLRAETKALGFEMSIDGEDVSYVVGDEGKIRQSLINLIGNAIKFTKQGRIHVGVNLAERLDGQLWLSASVEDSGSGLTEEEQARLFEPFSQTKRGSQAQEGTGLGLAISRKYAQLMGGDITVRSRPGEGSIFRFEVPIERGDAGIAIKRNAPRHVIGIRAGSQAPRILVVDDQLENRDWLTRLLISIGFSVQQAENGEAAIRKWEEWDPELILMDVHMPVMDGLEATRRMKAYPRKKETAILVLTASAMDDDRRRIAKSGADDFLAKPCLEDELLERMRALLHITYDYEPTGEGEGASVARVAVSAARLKQLPPELTEELRQATLSGNKRLLDKLIVKVRDTEDAGFVHALQELVDQYEYDALLRLLEEACSR